MLKDANLHKIFLCERAMQSGDRASDLRCYKSAEWRNEPCQRIPQERTRSVLAMEGNVLDTTGQPEEDHDVMADRIRKMRMCVTEKTTVQLHSLEDWYLLRFLRAAFFDVDAALRLVQNYESFKVRQGPGWTVVQRALLRTVGDSGVVQVVAGRGPTGCRVLWLRLGCWQPRTLSADELMQVCGLCGEAAAMEPRTQAAGVVALFDMSGMGLTHLKAVSPAFARKMVFYITSCFPLRLNAVHVVHEPVIFAMFFAIFKGLLNDRMRKQLYFHGHDMKSLHQHLPAQILPAELGGTLPAISPQRLFATLDREDISRELKNVGYAILEDP